LENFKIKTSQAHLDCQVYDHIDDCATYLDSDGPFLSGLFLQVPYLRAVETSLGKVMQFRYILLFDGLQLVGLSYCQIHPFAARDSLKLYRPNREIKLGETMKWALSHWVNFKALVCGNLLLTGRYGFYFTPSFQTDQLMILEKVWQQLFDFESRKDCNLSVLFIKDFEKEFLGKENPGFLSDNYFDFSVQPAMVLEIASRWKTIDDYLKDLKSKYRVRMNQARKRKQDLQVRNLTLIDLMEEKSNLQHLLNQVLDQSDFRIVKFDLNYLIEIKKNIPELFEIRGYFFAGQLIGFMSYFKNSDKIIAHFTGFDPVLNKKLDLYLNMLLDLISVSIDFSATHLDLSRTALEIKSSIGAEPKFMTNFIKHRNGPINRILPGIFNTLYQAEDWVQRKPFRQSPVSEII
jgi:hypothetical protein